MSIGRPPLIGLTGRRSRASILGVPRGFADAPLDIYMSEYASSVTRAGGLPVHLPLDADPALLADRVDAVILSGGEDVDPRRYGGVPGPRSGDLDPQRDEFEVALVDAACERGIPLLGICRGAQLINVARGGTLVSDLVIGEGESHASYAYPRKLRVHSVRTTTGTVIGGIYGERLAVNSFHHQSVDRCGGDVVVSARAGDGVIEAIEVTGTNVVGLQWHPEVFGDDPIFRWVVQTAMTSTVRMAG